MKSNYRRLLSVLIACMLAVPVFLFTGCQTGLFKKPDLPKIELPKIEAPDLSKLAFWKKENSAELPPPPAHHLQPAPMSERTADKRDSDLQQQFNNLAREARKEKEELKKQSPLRNPYQITPLNDKSSNRSNNNSFDFSGGDFSGGSGSKDSGSGTKNDFSSVKQAQNQFLADMNQLSRNLGDATTDLTQQAQEKISQLQDSGQTEMEKMKARMALAKQELATMKNQLTDAKQQTVDSVQNSATQLAATVSQTTQSAQQAIGQTFDQAAKLKLTTNPATTDNFSPLTTTNNSLPNNVLRPNPVLQATNQSNVLTAMPSNDNHFQPSVSQVSSNNMLTPNQPVRNEPLASNPKPDSIVIPAQTNTAWNHPHTASANSHVSNVDIPDAILQGSSSYAPGSVNPLKPILR